MTRRRASRASRLQGHSAGLNSNTDVRHLLYCLHPDCDTLPADNMMDVVFIIMCYSPFKRHFLQIT